jgi:hypothetical protein
MERDVRREIVKWMRDNDLSYEDIYKPLGFHKRRACHAFLHSKHFNRYQDLMSRFEKLKANLEEDKGQAK